ncbi:CAP domain-containing protein [Chelativorans sp. Marseille-P2723]|uniref:CAP domain-containing protein n=1 Tax=Chelativorans sp. Marseille-P2723 TaxID=2709133 RepID=UPI00157100C4|nr:CAP domain-containing protein [Chelativorans sp. Marseille-P2723]
MNIVGSLKAVAGLLAIALIVAGCASQPLSNNDLDRIADLGALRQEALTLVNQTRRREGVPQLRRSAQLDAAAQAHAEDMARRGFYAHVSPERGDVGSRYRASGGGDWRIIAENINQCVNCRASVEQMRTFHQRWLASRGHRRNIVDPRLEAFGFGVASAGGRVYAVQTFVTERP